MPEHELIEIGDDKAALPGQARAGHCYGAGARANLKPFPFEKLGQNRRECVVRFNKPEPHWAVHATRC